MAQPSDDVAYLLRSEARVDVLERASDGGPCERAALIDDGARSRRTIKRALDGLEGRGLIAVDAGSVALTALGRCVLEGYRSMVDAVEVSVDLGPVLRRIPADAFDLPASDLAGAEVVTASEGSPYAPIDRVLALRRDATELRELSSIVLKESAEQLADRAREGGDLDVHVVLERAAVEAATANPDYREAFEAIQGAPSVAVSVYDGSFPYLLVIADDAVAIGVEEDERPVAVAVSRSATVREWAEVQFRAFDDEASPIEA